MNDFASRSSVFLLWALLGVSEIYGLYLSGMESFFSFCIALVIPPWAVLKGFLGLLQLIF